MQVDIRPCSLPACLSNLCLCLFLFLSLLGFNFCRLVSFSNAPRSKFTAASPSGSQGDQRSQNQIRRPNKPLPVHSLCFSKVKRPWLVDLAHTNLTQDPLFPRAMPCSFLFSFLLQGAVHCDEDGAKYCATLYKVGCSGRMKPVSDLAPRHFPYCAHSMRCTSPPECRETRTGKSRSSSQRLICPGPGHWVFPEETRPHTPFLSTSGFWVVLSSPLFSFSPSLLLSFLAAFHFPSPAVLAATQPFLPSARRETPTLSFFEISLPTHIEGNDGRVQYGEKGRRSTRGTTPATVFATIPMYHTKTVVSPAPPDTTVLAWQRNELRVVCFTL